MDGSTGGTRYDETYAAWRRDPNALAKHVHLELWGRTCVRGEDPDELGARLEAAVSSPR